MAAGDLMTAANGASYRLALADGFWSAVAEPAEVPPRRSTNSIGGDINMTSIAGEISRSHAEPAAPGIASRNDTLAPAGKSTIVLVTLPSPTPSPRRTARLYLGSAVLGMSETCDKDGVRNMGDETA